MYSDHPATAAGPSSRGGRRHAPSKLGGKLPVRSRCILLPGEDPHEFESLRREYYEEHRPGTPREVRCVEAIITHEWAMERESRFREAYYAKLHGTLHGVPDGEGGSHCESDPHRWHHSAIDCTLQEARLQRNQDRAQKKLVALQKRRKKRSADALKAQDALDTEGAEPWADSPEDPPDNGSQPVVHAEPRPEPIIDPVPAASPPAPARELLRLEIAPPVICAGEDPPRPGPAPERSVTTPASASPPVSGAPPGPLQDPRPNRRPLRRDEFGRDPRGRLIGGIGLRRIFVPWDTPGVRSGRDN